MLFDDITCSESEFQRVGTATESEFQRVGTATEKVLA